MPTELIVTTHREWLSSAFIEAAEKQGLPARKDYGFDVPILEAGAQPAWWVSGEHAARLVHAGVPFPMLCPGPFWLSAVPVEYTHRRVWVGRLHALNLYPHQQGFAKAAEAKTDKLPAQWYEDITEFGTAAYAAGLTDDSWIQVSDKRLNLFYEVRVLISNHIPVASSIYMFDGEPVSDTGLEEYPMWKRVMFRAETFAREVATNMAVCSPSTYTMDVASFPDGTMCVVEANNTWSSNPYDIDPGTYVSALIEAADYDRKDPENHFRPDDYLATRAKSLPVLPTRTGSAHG